MKKIKRMTCGLLPLLAGAAVLIEHYTVPNAQAVSGTLPVFIGILMCGVLILTLLSIQSSSVLNWLRDRSARYTAIFLIFLVLDVLTQKTGIFGPPMFPSPDRLLAELVLDRSILLDCAGNSLKLLFTGYFWGMLIGLLTGIPAGRSRKARYWIAPILRVLAPIPSVTWMALFFVLSKSLFQGCVAMVAYSVWYPVASGIMRGILQVDHAYIEAAQTLGASSEWKILRYVTLPSVLPCLFQGKLNHRSSLPRSRSENQAGGERGMSQPTIRKQRIRRSSVKVRLIVFGTLAVLLILFSVFSEQLTPYDPYLQDLSNAKAPPSAEHLLGTDRYGRDMLSRVIVGSRTSIFSTLLLVAVITVLGTAVGVFCGWNGRWMDTVLMRISDMFLAFPGLVFALAVAGSLGGGLQNAILALAAISWPKYARIARSQTLAQKETVWMKAAKLSGSSSGKLIFKHILPNIIGPILVTAMLDIGTMMMELAALSFLGLGAKPPTAEWGSMMSDTRSLMTTSPWITFSPGIAIFISVMVFNLLGDTIRDYADPKSRGR